MKKDLFNIDINNSSDESGLLFPQLTYQVFESECKKINMDKWRKIN